MKVLGALVCVLVSGCALTTNDVHYKADVVLAQLEEEADREQPKKHSKGTSSTQKNTDPNPVASKPNPPVSPTTDAEPTGDRGRRTQIRKRWAVIIGVSQYAKGDGSPGNLAFAADDAKDVSKALVAQGWGKDHIRLLVNDQATERNVKIALESWLTKAGADDLILLFWAGHGYPDPDDPEKVYFACHDTDIRVPATGYRMDRVVQVLRERKARNVLVMADTCHAGKLATRGDRGMSVMPAVKKMRKQKKVPKGWIFMLGADADRKAVENTKWSNGAFTHCLLKGLGGKADGYNSAGPKDGTVTMGELKEWLNSAMPDETQKVLGTAKRPLITTSSGDPGIWDLTLKEE